MSIPPSGSSEPDKPHEGWPPSDIDPFGGHRGPQPGFSSPAFLPSAPVHPSAQTPPGAPPQQRRGPRGPVLIGAALLGVIAVAIGATMLVLRHDSNDSQGAPSRPLNESSDVASAGDTGPVTIITSDPTCVDFGATLNNSEAKLGEWSKRDTSIPAAAWTPQIRTMHEDAATVFRTEADQLVTYARNTPHRVMRQLYEQAIAFDRAYADAIPNYTPTDNNLALASNSLEGAAISICATVRKFSAPKRSSLVQSALPPSSLAPISDPANPTRFLTPPTPICAEWMTLTADYADEIHQLYAAIDNTVAAADWTPDVRASWDRLAEIYGSYFAPRVEELGRKSANPVWEDFAVLAAQYYRAFAAAVPTYTVNDWYFANVGANTIGAVRAACQTLG